jgi:hypothetical protein
MRGLPTGFEYLDKLLLVDIAVAIFRLASGSDRYHELRNMEGVVYRAGKEFAVLPVPIVATILGEGDRAAPLASAWRTSCS